MTRRIHCLVFVLVLILCGQLFLVETLAVENTTDFLGGEGTAESPYLIASTTHLDHIRFYPDAYFEIVTDIIFQPADFAEGGNFYNGGQGWIPVTEFTGTLDGKKHYIKYLKSTQSNNAGLFGTISGGTIRDLGLSDVIISGTESAGGIAAECINANITYCSVSGSVDSNHISEYATSITAYSGGIVGYSSSSIIEHCTSLSEVYSYAKTTYHKQYGTTTTYAYAYVGGIVGYASEGIINDCHNSGNVSGDAGNNPNANTDYYSAYVGGIVGSATATDIRLCSNRITIDCSQKYASIECGGIIGVGSDNTIIDQCYNTGDVIGGNGYTSSTGGIIASAQGIAGLGQASVITNTYNIGTVCGSQAGGISGNYGTIENCYSVGYITGGTLGGIKSTYDNIYKDTSGIINCYFADVLPKTAIDGDNAVCMSLSQLQNMEVFSSTYDFFDIWMFDNLSAYPYPTLRNNPHCEPDVSDEFAGGNGTTYNPYQISTVEQLKKLDTGEYSSYLLISDLSLESNWIPIDDFTGFLDGNNHVLSGMTISKTYTNDTAEIYVGLFSETSGTISNIALSECTIDVTNNSSQNINIGGIAGKSTGVIRNCHVNGTITGKQKGDSYLYCGGIVGSGSVVYGCNNAGNITASLSANNRHAYSGGIAGKCSNISCCRNSGDIKASVYISNYSSTTVSASVNACGIAYSCSTVSDCYNTGKITTSHSLYGNNVDRSCMSYPCGIVCSVTTICNCYNVGLGSGTFSRSGSSGTTAFYSVFKNATSAEGCYFPSATNAKSADDSSACKATEKTTEDLQLQSTYESYDFGSVWAIDVFSGYLYPQFKHELKPVQSIAFQTQQIGQIETVEKVQPNLAGIMVQQTYMDGTTIAAPLSMDMLPDLDLSTIGLQVVRIRYNGIESESCISILVKEKTPVSIAVSTSPMKVKYISGEPISTEGGVITVTYDNGEASTVDMETDMLSGFDTTVQGNQTITVTYYSLTGTYNVTVIIPKSILVSTLPVKLSYVQGQPLNLDGKMTVTFSDESEIIYNLSDAEITFDPVAVGTVPVYVSFLDCQTSYNIEVIERTVKSIYLIQQPTKLNYIQGEQFDTSGSQLRITYVSDDNYNETVELSLEMLSGYSPEEVGIQTITVNVGGQKTSFVVRVLLRCGIESITCNQLVTVKVTGTFPETYILLVVSYDGNGRMLDVTQQAISTSGEYVFMLNLSGAKTVTAFVVTESWSPVCQSATQSI